MQLQFTHFYFPVSIHLGDSAMACGRHLGPRDIHLAEFQGCGCRFSVLLAAPQEGRAHRKSSARSRKDQHRRSRCAALPAWDRSHLRVLRLPLRRRRSGYHPTASSPELANHTAHRAHDRRCQQVCAHTHQSDYLEITQVKGNLDFVVIDDKLCCLTLTVFHSSIFRRPIMSLKSRAGQRSSTWTTCQRRNFQFCTERLQLRCLPT